jgi:hypothetical protein
VSERPRVLVVGCGFGGLEAVRALSKAPVEITLVDRTNHHLFQPFLYQVATGILSAGEIAPATRDVLKRHKNVAVEMSTTSTAPAAASMSPATPIVASSAAMFAVLRFPNFSVSGVATLGITVRAPSGQFRVDDDNGHVYKTPRIGELSREGFFEVVWSAPSSCKPDPFPFPELRERIETIRARYHAPLTSGRADGESDIS